MSLRSTRLYYNTGLGVGDVLYDVSILNSAYYLDLESHWDYQELFLTSIKLKATWDQVQGADYLRYGAAYYWVTGISMINERNAELFLKLDPITTLHGMNNIAFIDGEGIIKRAHPLNDNPFANLLPEPIGPQETLELNAKRKMIGVANPDSSNQRSIIVSSVSLHTSLDYDSTTGSIVPSGTQKSITFGEENQVVIPAPPSGSVGCTVNGFHSPLDYYEWNNTTTPTSDPNCLINQISYLRAIGLEQAIQACYILPNAYIQLLTPAGNVGNKDKMISILTGKANDVALSDMVWNQTKSGVTSKWKKTLQIANTYVVSSLLSGETQVYKAEDIVGVGRTYPQFRYIADVNINGKPYIWPKFYHGEDMTAFIGANGVSGMEWLRQPLVLDGTSGSIWINNNQIQQKGESHIQAYQNALSGAERVFNDIVGTNVTGNGTPQTTGGPALGTANVGFDLGQVAINTAKYNYSVNKIYTDYAQQSVINALPDVFGNCSPGLQGLIPNDFVCYHFTLGANDISRIDKFFDNYGYAQNCVFDKRYIDLNPNGQGFCYLQATGVKIDKTQASIAIRSLCEEQINNGVRIWRRLPS